MKDADGQWTKRCPFAEIVPAETWEAIRLHRDWKRGHTPVTFGWTSDLTRPFVESMHVLDDLMAEQEEQAAERAKARAEARRG